MNRRGSLVGGFILILIGILILLNQIGVGFGFQLSWPLILVGMGLLFILFGAIFGIGGLAVPGSILGGLGLIFYYQDYTGDFSSWAYMWALIPGFVGVGVLISGIINPGTGKGGWSLIAISAILFTIFAAIFGDLNDQWVFYISIAIIIFGVIGLIRALIRLFRPGTDPEPREEN
jgi:hypothetical protein